MLLALSGLVAMFDFIELLRRSASQPGGELRPGQRRSRRCACPTSSMQILPFAVLLGGILCFWRLTRSSELIVARAAGVSAWEFLTAPTLCALLFGVLGTAAVSPLSSVMLARAEALENAYLRTGGGPLALNGGQLWLRQSDRELDSAGRRHHPRQQVALHGKQLTATQVSVFRLDGGDQLLARVEATRATLGSRHWELDEARRSGRTSCRNRRSEMNLPTDLTVTRVQDSFASPDTLSVWALPDFIALLDRSGFSSIRHRLHFQALLALPLLCATMAWSPPVSPCGRPAAAEWRK